MNLGDHLNLNSKNEKAADVLSSFMSSEEVSGNHEIKKTAQEPQVDLEKTKDIPLELQELNEAFARFQKKYEKYHQRPTFGQWKEFVEEEKIPLKEARKELSGLLAGELSIKTDKEGLVTIDSLLGYVSRLNGDILDSDKERIRYNRSITEKYDENPTIPPKYQAYKGNLPTDSQQWVQSLEELTDQNNIVVPTQLEKISAQHTDSRLRERVIQDPVVNKLMDTILPIPEKKNPEPLPKPNKVISKPRVAYDPRKKFEELDALKYNTAYHNQQAQIRRDIQKELLSRKTTRTESQGPAADIEKTEENEALEQHKKFIAEQVESMSEEERRDMTKALSQQFLEESLVNKKHRHIDLSVFEKPGMFSKDFITEVLLEDAEKNVQEAPASEPAQESDQPLSVDETTQEETASVVDTIDSTESLIDIPNEPRIFRKEDGTEVRENLGVETEKGFINVSPLDANNRYAVGEEKLERVLRTFQDAEGNTFQETNHPGVGQGYVNVKGADGRQYAKKMEGLTRVNVETSAPLVPSETKENTIGDSTMAEEKEDDVIIPEDAGTYISRHEIEDAQMENIETTDINLVRQAYKSGTRPILKYNGHDIEVVSMSNDTMVVAYGNQRRTIDAGDELAKDMREGKISFTVSAETQTPTPESRQEKAQKDFQEKYKADVKGQPLWERLYHRVRYGRGEGDFLEQQAMSESTQESYRVYQGAMKEKAQATYDAFMSKMDGKEGWDDARKQEVAKRLRDRYYGIQYLRGRQVLLRELRTEAIEEKNPKLTAFLNFSEKWKNFEQKNKKEAALLKVGGASLVFAGSVVAFGGLRVVGGALAGFLTRTALNSKHARLGNVNLHTEELITSQYRDRIHSLEQKARQDKQNSSKYRQEADALRAEMNERSRVEQLRKDFESGKIDGVELQQKLENIDRGDVRRFRANWFFTAVAAGLAGRAAGQSEFLHTALADLGVPRNWMDGYLFSLAPENPQPIAQETTTTLEPTAQRVAEVVTPEVTPEPVIATADPVVTQEAVTQTVEATKEAAPEPVQAKEIVTQLFNEPQPVIVNPDTVYQAPIEQVVATDTVIPQPEYQAPSSEWKGGEINVEMKGPKIDGFKGTGTYKQYLPGSNVSPDDPTYGYVQSQQGGLTNTNGPIENPNAKIGPGIRVGMDNQVFGDVRIEGGNGKNIPTRNDNPTGPGDVFIGVQKRF